VRGFGSRPAKPHRKKRRLHPSRICTDHLRDDRERLVPSNKEVPLGFRFNSDASSPSTGRDFARWQRWPLAALTLAMRLEDPVGRVEF